MSARIITLAALMSSVLVAAPLASADPTDKNKNLVERTLLCDGQQYPSTFVAPMGSNFNLTQGQRVFVYKYIDVGGAEIVRGLQGFDNNHELITCTYSFDGTDVTAIGFFTGPSS
jgi:hypothetical protein